MVEPEQSPYLLEDLSDFEFEENPTHTGGCSLVYKGIIKSTGQEVAAKKPKPNDEIAFSCLVQEYNMMLTTKHPLIQILIGFYCPSDHNECLLITPYYNKGSLNDHIKKKKVILTLLISKY